MAEEKVTSYIGGHNSHYVVVVADDGESFRFDAGVKYANEDIPKSVLSSLDDVPGREFTSGTDRTVERHLADAREEQVDAPAEEA